MLFNRRNIGERPSWREQLLAAQVSGAFPTDPRSSDMAQLTKGSKLKVLHLPPNPEPKGTAVILHPQFSLQARSTRHGGTSRGRMKLAHALPVKRSKEGVEKAMEGARQEVGTVAHRTPAVQAIVEAATPPPSSAVTPKDWPYKPVDMMYSPPACVAPDGDCQYFCQHICRYCDSECNGC